MGNSESAPPLWEDTVADRRRRHQEAMNQRAANRGRGGWDKTLRRWMPCDYRGIVDGGPPLVIEKAPTGLTAPAPAKAREEQGSDDNDDSDEFEHLGSSFMRFGRNSTTKGGKGSKFRTKRSARARAIQKKSGLKRGKFDHESSFTGTMDDFKKGLPPSIAVTIKGSVRELEDILDQTSSAVNAHDKYGQTPLFYACSGDVPEAAQKCDLLLKARANVNAHNQYGYTPLMRAVRHGDQELAARLVDHAADLAAKDKFGSTCFFVASAAGKLGCVNWLLEQAVCQEQEQFRCGDADETTPLLAAARGGHGKVCTRLLEARAEPDHADALGRTALLFAFARDDVHLARSLLECRADVDAVDEQGKCVLAALVDNMAKYPEFRATTLCGLASACSAGADLDAQDDTGRTPLFIATKSNLPSAVAVLAAFGADPLIPDDSGKFAIFHAKKNSLFDVVPVLREFGGTARKKSAALERVLLRAAYYGNVAACKSLLERGASSQAKSKKGISVMNIAKRVGHSDIVKSLKEGADDEAAELEDDAGVAADKDGLQNPDVLQRWLDALGDTERYAATVASAIARDDRDSIAKVAAEIVQNQLDLSEGNSDSRRLLGEHIRYRRLRTLKTARVECRRIRAEQRCERCKKLCSELKAWSRESDKRYDTYSAIIAASSSIRGNHTYDFERDDEYTQAVEGLQVKTGSLALTRCHDVIAVLTQEFRGAEAMPSEHEMPKLDPLQCSKCLNAYANKKALEGHSLQCFSSAGRTRMQNHKDNLKKQASSAIHTIDDCAKNYKAHVNLIETSKDDFKRTEKEARRKLPEVVPFAMLCQDLADVMIAICKQRAEECREYCNVQGKHWGLSSCAVKLQDDVCQECLLKPITKAAVHSDTERCDCLCDDCAYMANLVLQAQKEWSCPLCKKPAISIKTRNPY
eukprot:TRINITY_DN38936_c0_g1_i1.p1 TRINITY_DN38936_c0_g1~~TRINITY_DN38936_c0_g1_i1.p1  ORF type:complete len:923 (+),score=150.02 TRINITY_DN38936_c0_g1_i1:87-2855(+)